MFPSHLSFLHPPPLHTHTPTDTEPSEELKVQHMHTLNTHTHIPTNIHEFTSLPLFLFLPHSIPYSLSRPIVHSTFSLRSISLILINLYICIVSCFPCRYLCCLSLSSTEARSDFLKQLEFTCFWCQSISWCATSDFDSKDKLNVQCID